MKELFKTHIIYKGHKIRLPTLGEVSKLNEPIKIRRLFNRGKERKPTTYELQERSIDLLYELGVPKICPIEDLNEIIKKIFRRK